MTNEEFALRVGCSESMASRLRSGARRPGTDLRDQIIRVFELDRDLATLREYMDVSRDASRHGVYLRRHIFKEVVTT